MYAQRLVRTFIARNINTGKFVNVELSARKTMHLCGRGCQSEKGRGHRLMAAPLSLSLSVSLCVCVSLSVSLYLCLSPSPVCLIAEGMWSSCRRLQNSTRHFRELMSLYYCTSSKQAALATCVSQSGRSHALLTRHTTADCTKIYPGVVAVLRAWAEGPQRRTRKRHWLCDPWAMTCAFQFAPTRQP